MKCPQCNFENQENATRCEECEFPFPEQDSNKDLQQLLAEIDEELEIEEDEEDDETDTSDVILPDDGSLLPLRLGTLAEIRNIIQLVIDNAGWYDDNSLTLEMLISRINPDIYEKILQGEITKDKFGETLSEFKINEEEIQFLLRYLEIRATEREFSDLIKDFQEEVDEKLEEMDQMVYSPQMYEVVKKSVKATRKAFEQYDKVLAEIRLYFSDRDVEHLNFSLIMEEEANKYLSLSFNIVRETMTKMLGF